MSDLGVVTARFRAGFFSNVLTLCNVTNSACYTPAIAHGSSR
jgi:hypothetical protein